MKEPEGNPTYRPAFPQPDLDCPLWAEGITIRDYFAAKVMQGFLSDSITARKFSELFDNDPIKVPLGMAERAYYFADAMLKAREK